MERRIAVEQESRALRVGRGAFHRAQLLRACSARVGPPRWHETSNTVLLMKVEVNRA